MRTSKGEDDQKIEVIFFPQRKKITSVKSASLKKIASKANVDIPFPCGGEGVCGKCKVKIKGSANNPTQKEKKIIPGKLKQEFRLACQVILEGNAEVHIPPSLVSALQILTTDSQEHLQVDPRIKKIFITLPPPQLENQTSDITRIKKELKDKGWDKLQVGLEVVREVPSVLRRSDFKVSCVVDNTRLVAVEKGDTRGKNFGVAFDVGTTTVVGSLIDLDTGKRLGVKAIANPQNTFGYDVISRVSYVQKEGCKGLTELQRKIIGAVNKIIVQLTEEAGVKKKNIYKITLVGNTVMQHLFAGINPLNLALYPYVSVIQDALTVISADLNIRTAPAAGVYIFPSIASFIGGDTVGLILSTGLHKKDHKVRLAVDVGTNGEIVLSGQDKLVATSTAAGPAFEGVKISQGMVATEGAIEKVSLKEGNVFTRVIGNGEPEGICGSGLVDAVSELYREKVIDDSGKIKPSSQQKKVWKKRVVEKEGQRCFILVDTGASSSVFISQGDIRELQLAKAAICTGIKTLLSRTGVKKNSVGEFLIAGAFGSYMDLQNAYRIGLFPKFPNAKVKVVGNAASLGAIKVLLCYTAREEAERIPSLTTRIDLASDPEFHKILSESMFLGQVE